MGKIFKGTYFISAIEFTSAITEFGISSIFTLFLLHVHHFSPALSSITYANYYGFAYLLPILLGYLTDKYLKESDALTLGLISMIISQFFLAFSSSLYQPSNMTHEHFLFSFQNITFIMGLFFLAFGTSLTNISIIRIIYRINDEKSSVHAYSIYYPISECGVIIGIILMSLIIGTENYHQYQWAFIVFGIILMIGLIVFLFLKNKFLVNIEGKLMKEDLHKESLTDRRNKFLSQMSSKSISKIKNLNFKERFLLFKHSLSSTEKNRLTVFLLFLIIIIFFNIAYSQCFTSIVFFLDSYVDMNVYAFRLPVQSFFIVTPLFILILSPMLIKFNSMLDEKDINFGFFDRTVLALLTMALCYVILSILGYFLDVDAFYHDKVSMFWMIVYGLLLAISELLFSIAGYSLVGDLVPKKYYSLFFGFFLATRAVGMYVSGLLSTTYPVSKVFASDVSFFFNIPINGLMVYFLIFVILNLISVAILIVYKDNIKRKMHLDEIK